MSQKLTEHEQRYRDMTEQRRAAKAQQLKELEKVPSVVPGEAQARQEQVESFHRQEQEKAREQEKLGKQFRSADESEAVRENIKPKKSLDEVTQSPVTLAMQKILDRRNKKNGPEHKKGMYDEFHKSEERRFDGRQKSGERRDGDGFSLAD